MITADNIRIVMIDTSDSGNIGAAARAIKTMGFSRLYLVNPQDYPSGKATARASGAADVLHQAVVVPSFEQAVADCQLVVGTSARLRSIPWPVMTPREFSSLLLAEPDASEVAIVFGRENSGLTNEELRHCNYHVSIPANPDYGVLNVAAAVQVICYELQATLSAAQAKEGEQVVDSNEPFMQVSKTQWDAPLSTQTEMEGFFQHMEHALLDIHFYEADNPRQIMTRVRRLFGRTRLDRLEMNLMRGILTRMQKLAKPEN